jgi:hypothetical protein
MKETIEAQVKLAIDKFDPMSLHPGDFAPADEYDGESRHIATKLYVGISKEQIADIIAHEFTTAFAQTFTTDMCSSPALEIYKALNEAV